VIRYRRGPKVFVSHTLLAKAWFAFLFCVFVPTIVQLVPHLFSVSLLRRG
jgi:hypothetical protein